MPLQTRHKCFFYCVNIECLNGKKIRVFLLKQIRWWLKFRVFYSRRKLKSNKKLTTFADRNEQKKNTHTHTDEKESPEKLLTWNFFFHRRLQFALHHQSKFECRETRGPVKEKSNKKRTKLIANFCIKSKRKCML